jgi:hypothetical protein
MSNILKTLAAGSVSGDYQISRSLRFNSADSAYLSKTPASAGNRKTWTWSGWVKRSNIVDNEVLFSAGDGSDSLMIGFAGNSGTLPSAFYVRYEVSSVVVNEQTVASFHDPSAWYHIVVAFDTTQVTANDRIKVYVNSVLQTWNATDYYWL